MKSKAAILAHLNMGGRLLNDFLRWDGAFGEFPVQFLLNAASTWEFCAQPELKLQLNEVSLRNTLEQMRERENRDGMPRMLIVPYLSPSLVEILTKEEKVFAADLCGNGVLKTNAVLFCFSNYPNLFPRPTRTAQPFRGLSSQVAFVLLEWPFWQNSLSIMERILLRGGQLSRGQLSKTLSAYVADNYIRNDGRFGFRVREPSYLMEQLLQQWKLPALDDCSYWRLTEKGQWPDIIKKATAQGIRWCYDPKSSLKRYASIGESGHARIWTDSPQFFMSFMEKCNSPAFADFHLSGTNSPLAYFQNVADENGQTWASPILTWMFCARGDARQQQAAQDIYAKLLNFGYAQLIS